MEINQRNYDEARGIMLVQLGREFANPGFVSVRSFLAATRLHKDVVVPVLVQLAQERIVLVQGIPEPGPYNIAPNSRLLPGGAYSCGGASS